MLWEAMVSGDGFDKNEDGEETGRGGRTGSTESCSMEVMPPSFGAQNYAPRSQLSTPPPEYRRGNWRQGKLQGRHVWNSTHTLRVECENPGMPFRTGDALPADPAPIRWREPRNVQLVRASRRPQKHMECRYACTHAIVGLGDEPPSVDRTFFGTSCKY